MAHVRKVTYKSGKIAWCATVRDLNGQRGTKYFPTKKEAEIWRSEHDRAGPSGSSSMTVLQLARHHNRWFDGIVQSGERRRGTADGYDSHARIHLETDELAKVLLSELDTPRCQGWLNRVIARTGSVERARRVRRSLSAWCAHGCREGWLKANPVPSTKIVKKRKHTAADRVTIPPKAVLSALLAAASKGPAPERDTAIVHLLMYAGLRISELLGAADGVVKFGRPTVIQVAESLCTRYVVLAPVKSEEGLRDVPLGPATTAGLRGWRIKRGLAATHVVDGERVSGRLFPGPNEPFWSYDEFRRQCWLPLMERAGLVETVQIKGSVADRPRRHKRPQFGPHALRHVYASIQIENSVSPKRLQALLGHADLAMTMDLYGHLWSDAAADEAMAEAVEKVIPGMPS